MSIVIVAEKPSIVRLIAPHARAHWPTEQLTIISAIPYGSNFTPIYPRGLPLAEYPRVAPVQVRVAPMGQSWHPMRVIAGGTCLATEFSDDDFKATRVILNACDVDSTGAMAFAYLIESHFGADALNTRQFPSLTHQSMDPSDVVSALNKTQNFADCMSGAISHGRVKRYFDWNWNANALVVLGSTARGMGLDYSPVSKYSLQLLYWLAGRGPVTEGTVYLNMSRWRGSGKLRATQELGSMASRVAMLHKLSEAGLIAMTEEGIIATPIGLKFLSKLHPDCYDPDLPSRLAAWCSEGLDAIPAVDRYIKTFFGKQKRFAMGK